MQRRFLLSLLLAGSAAAAPRTAALAVGDCHDEELLSLSSELAQALSKRRTGEEFLTNEAVRVRIGVPESTNPDELRLRLNGAQTLFYNGALIRADEQLVVLATDISKLPLSKERLALFQDTHVLRAMTLRNLDRLAPADDELKAVLRTDPGFTLDPENYAPALRARLEKLRKDLGPTATLRISSEPSGATVFVDGKSLGTTPFQRDLPLGVYDVSLSISGRPSFPRTVRLDNKGLVSLRVDLAFETSVDVHGFPCLQELNAREPRMGNAIKLATLLEVEELVLVRFEHPASGASWLTAWLVNVQSAQRVREGGIQVKRDVRERQSALEELAQFALTGAPGPQVTPIPVATAGPLLVGPASVPGPQRTWKTPVGITAAVVGAGAIATGIVLAVQSAGHWSQFDQYYLPPGTSPPPSQIPTVGALKQQAELERTWAIVSLSGGAVFAAGSAVLLVLENHGEKLGLKTQSGVTLQPVVSPWSVGLAGTY